MALTYSRYNVWSQRGDHVLVHNGMSGEVHYLTAEARDAVNVVVAGGPVSGVDPEVLERLVRARILIGSDVDELRVLRNRYAASSLDAGHLGLTLITSLGCNFDCPYCYEDKKPSLLGPEVQAGVLQLLDDRIENLRELVVTWFGGEPLMGLKSLVALSDAFLERCAKHDVDYSALIVTNGWLLSGATAKMLADRKVQTAQVTIDGPPDVHNRMRPYVDGRPTFDRIVDNIVEAVEYLDIDVRVNLDGNNLGRAEELMEILAGRGLAGKIELYPAQLTSVEYAPAPGSTYQGCFSRSDFAQVALEFNELARQHGFKSGPAELPKPTGSPCTAVRANELIVGADGELWKCWEEVGVKEAAHGDIRTYHEVDSRVRRWLTYDPFANEECKSCIALPVCMGGCVVHAFSERNYANRCGDFRFNHQRHIDDLMADVFKEDRSPLELTFTNASRRLHGLNTKPAVATPTPVTITRKPVPVG